jgi:hypothetical protein
VDILKRIENARVALHLNHGEMAKELGVSRAMYYCVKKGEKPLGNKAYRELERLEGGTPVVPREYSSQNYKQLYLEEKARADRLEKDIEKIRKIVN